MRITQFARLRLKISFSLVGLFIIGILILSMFSIDHAYAVGCADTVAPDFTCEPSDVNRISDTVSKSLSKSLSEAVSISDTRSSIHGTPIVVTGGGGFRGSITPPSFSTGFSESEYPLSINGNNFRLPQNSNIIPTQVIHTREPVNLKLLIYDDSGTSSIQHVALYTNLYGIKREIHQSDTYLVYEKGKPLEINDPNGFFSKAGLTLAEKGNKLELTFEITFAKEMPKSDIIIRSWDSARNSVDRKILEAWQIVKSTSEPDLSEIEEPKMKENPEALDKEKADILPAIKKWGGYSSESLSDSELLKTIGVEGDHIPQWFKKVSEWTVFGKINQQEFIDALKYMHKKGIV